MNAENPLWNPGEDNCLVVAIARKTQQDWLFHPGFHPIRGLQMSHAPPIPQRRDKRNFHSKQIFPSNSGFAILLRLLFFQNLNPREVFKSKVPQSTVQKLKRSKNGTGTCLKIEDDSDGSWRYMVRIVLDADQNIKSLEVQSNLKFIKHYRCSVDAQNTGCNFLVCPFLSPTPFSLLDLLVRRFQCEI